MGKDNFIANSEIATEKARLAKELEQGVSTSELLEARKVVEVGITGLAAEKASGEDLSEIELILTAQGHDCGLFKGLGHMDLEIHLAIVKSTKNAVLIDIFKRNIAPVKVTMPRRISKSMRRFFHALNRRDAEGAKKRMQRHLQAIKGDFLEDSV